MQKTLSEERSKYAALESRIQEERKATDEKLALIKQAEQQLLDAFKALSSESLRSNNQTFIDLAKTTLENFQNSARSDLEKRQQAIVELIKPVRESLDKFDTKVGEIEKTRSGAYEGLVTQVRGLMDLQTQLRTETSNLSRALRAPAVRGRWGEMQLQRVVEMAGMVEHCHFEQQSSQDTETGRLRPDLVVRLPGGKQVVVDAKAPLEAFLKAVEATEEAERVRWMQDHARQIRTHITALSRKSYWEQFQPAPEFVVLFLPSESMFSAALEQDPALIESGVEQKVILATPTTLIALLRAVAYGWRQEKLAENAQAISELGRELYKRLSDMGGHWARMGKALGSAVDHYNKAVGSMETRVMACARRFKELEASASGSPDIEDLLPVESSPRTISAPEISAEKMD